MTRLLLVTGEPSGDALARQVLSAWPGGPLEVYGVFGEAVAGLGFRPYAPPAGANGLVDVGGSAGALLRVAGGLAQALAAPAPDRVLTVDHPTLALRFQALAARAFPAARRFHLVAPQAWAWRPGRVRRWRSQDLKLLCLFPFEPAWFAARGIAAEFHGHPLVERPDQRALSGSPLTLALAPGSRERVRRRHLPWVAEVVAALRRREPRVRLSALLAPGQDPEWAWRLGATPVRGLASLRAHAALAAAGTVTLELVAAGIPVGVFYRADPATHALGRRLVRGVRYLGWPNLLAGRPVTPEWIQHGDPEDMATSLLALAGAAGDAQRAALRGPLGDLRGSGAAERLAAAVAAG